MRWPTASAQWALFLVVAGFKRSLDPAMDEASVSTQTQGIGDYVVQGLGGVAQTSGTSLNTSTAFDSSTSSAFTTNSTITSTRALSASPARSSNGTITVKETSTSAGTLTTHASSANASSTNTSSTSVFIQTSCAYSDLDCQHTCNSYTSSCDSAWYSWDLLSESWFATFWPTDSSGYSFQTATVTFDGPPTSTDTYTYWSFLETPITTVTSAVTYTYPTISLISETVLYTSFTRFTIDPVTEAGSWTYALSEETLSMITSAESYIETSYQTVMTSLPFSVPQPVCNQEIACTMGANPVCDASDQCTIYGGTVQLLYFPVTTGTASVNATSATLAAATTANVTAPSTSDTPVIAIYDGTTLTSPSVYISFATIYAENRCNTTIGSTYSGSILGLLPEDLSSALGNVHALETLTQDSTTTARSMYAVPFDLADLNWPYNPYGWDEQLRCQDFIANTCPVVISGEYRPIIVVPTAVRDLDPAWASCALDWEGLYDPPTALTPVNVIASPTLHPGTSQTTPATPSPTGDSPTPSPTTKPTAGASSSIAASTKTSASQTQPSAESETLGDPPSSSQQSSKQTDTAATDPEQTSTEGSGDPGNTDASSDPESTPASTQSGAQATSQPPASSQGDASGPTTSAVGTVGSGSDAVTFVPDPTSSNQVIAISSGGTTTLTPGATGTINGQSFSVGSTGAVGLVSPSTISFASAAGSAYSATTFAFIGSQSGSQGQVVSVGSTFITLQSGQAATITGTNGVVTVSAATSGGAVVLLSQGSASTLQPAPSAYVVGGASQVLTAGGPAVTLSGTVYSVPQSGHGVVASAGGSETTITPSAIDPGTSLDPGVVGVAPSTALGSAENDPVATVNGLVVSEVSAGIVIDGSTMTSGSAPTTIAGAVYSLASDGNLVFWSQSTINGQPGGAFATVIDAALSAAEQYASQQSANRTASGTFIGTGSSTPGTGTSTSATLPSTAGSGGGNTTSSSSTGVHNGANVSRPGWACAGLLAMFLLALAIAS